MLDPKRIRSRKLRNLFKGKEAGIRPEWRRKTERVLAILNVATSPGELDLPGMGLHKLKGDRPDTFSVIISKNWRLTFRWDDDGPYDVDLEDYHGG